ncbi:MAG: hypothetical protein IPG68_08495 [Micrococcales bacterium]|nr:hypothetical protein [Micrococcales bacterium]
MDGPRSALWRSVGVEEQLERYADLGFDVAAVDVRPLEAVKRRDSVLVLPHALVPVQEVIARLRLAGGSKTGIFDRNFEDPDRYHPVAADVPVDRPYLIHGFEPGVEYLNVPPRQAVPQILARGRLPVTIEEGLGVFVHNPSVLQRNECFSLAGSTRGDKRVPALWISGNAPKLGWCFAGAPHTWLGTASVAGRLDAFD